MRTGEFGLKMPVRMRRSYRLLVRPSSYRFNRIITSAYLSPWEIQTRSVVVADLLSRLDVPHGVQHEPRLSIQHLHLPPRVHGRLLMGVVDESPELGRGRGVHAGSRGSKITRPVDRYTGLGRHESPSLSGDIGSKRMIQVCVCVHSHQHSSSFDSIELKFGHDADVNNKNQNNLLRRFFLKFDLRQFL